MKKVIFTLVCLFSFILGKAQLSQNGLLFDGVDDRVIIPNNNAYNFGSGNLTIETWFRCDAPAATSVWQYLISQSSSSVFTGFGLSLAYSGSPSFTINGSGYGPAGTFNLRDGQCHHLALVRKDSIITFYLDGAALPGTSTIGTAINTTNPICLGSYNATPPSNSSPFKGLMKEVRFWNVARTNAELLTYMNTIPPAITAGLVAYWRMNSAAGQTVADVSLNTNNGVLGSNANVENLDPAFSTGCPSCNQSTAILSANGSLSFCIGDSTLISANSGAGYSYQWYRNGTIITGATGISYYAKLSGAYSIRLTNATGCISYSNAINVTQLLDNVGFISCTGITVGAWACLNGGSSRTLSVGTGPGYIYQWKKNGVNIGGATAPTYTTTVAGTYTCYTTSGSCSRTSSAFVLGANPVTLTASGSATVCTGPVGLLATRTYGGSATFDWKLNGVSLSAPNNWTYNANQSGFYTCVVTDAICPGSITSNSLAVTVGVLPAVYIAPNPGTQVISDCINSSVNLSAVDVNGVPYPWDPGIISMDWFYNGNTLSGANTLTATESGIYSLYVNSTCGLVSSLQPKVVLLTNPSTLPIIYYNSLVGCSQVALSVDNYWTSVQWKLNGNNIAGATNWNFNATQSGSYTCQLFNACGSITTTSVNVSILGNSPIITVQNGTVICNGSYKLLQAPLGSGLSYQWKLNGNNILNATLSSFGASLAGSYSCQVTSSCGSLLSNSLVLTTSSTPAVPNTISGNVRPCPGSNTFNYSISSVANASTYTWNLPVGMNLVSGQGTTSIVANISPGFLSGTLFVNAGNACGNSASSSKLIKTKVPSAPTSITGSTIGVCSSNKSYSINTVNQATGYVWSIPPGATILSGQGTTNINVSFSNAYGEDSIRVYAYNNCSMGASKAIMVKGRPALPATISGSANVCAGQVGLSYSIAPISGATSYTWTKPSGATITNGQGTTQISMNMGAASGVIKVKSVNTCGVSANKTKSLNVVCREEGLLEIENSIVLSPNPFNNTLYIDISDFETTEATGRIWNALGQIVETFTLMGSNGVEVGHHLQQGIYIVEVDIDGQSLRKMIIKEK